MTKGGGSSTESPPFLFARYATPSNDIRREAGRKTRPENPGGQEGRKEEKNSEQGYLAASSLLAVSLDSLFGMTQNLSNG